MSRQILASISSILRLTNLEGRRAGEQGATFAAGYIANQFANLRLKPGVRGSNGKPGFLQPFSYTPVRDPHSTLAELDRGGVLQTQRTHTTSSAYSRGTIRS